MTINVILKDLEGKSEATLRNLYADALKAESMAKQQLYMLRARLVTLSTDMDEEEEKMLVETKKLVKDALDYMRALEIKLGLHPAPSIVPATPAEEPIQD